MGRYIWMTPRRSTDKFVRATARIAVLGLGADGVLRVGTKLEAINLLNDMDVPLRAMPWDDIRLRRVPSAAIYVRRWEASPDPVYVAAPGEVLTALTTIAAGVLERARRDLALLQRLG
jgi:hypothetical protein